MIDIRFANFERYTIDERYSKIKLFLIRIILAVFLIFLFRFGFAQEKTEHFRGGMLLHSGYISNEGGLTKIEGLCTGIGGKMVFMFGKNVRLGTEGYVSNYNYKKSNGFYKLGWGGLLTEWQFSNRKIRPVIGVSIGGGRIRDLYPVLGNYSDNESDEIIFKDYSTMVIAPNFSVEYGMSAHLNVVLKVDYLLYPGISKHEYIAKGPRIYLGILFSR